MEWLRFSVAAMVLLKFSDGKTGYCYMKDNNPYLYFGSKTSYDLVRGQDFSVLPGDSRNKSSFL